MFTYNTVEYPSFPRLETIHLEHTTSDEISPRKSFTSLSVPITSLDLPLSSIRVVKQQFSDTGQSNCRMSPNSFLGSPTFDLSPETQQMKTKSYSSLFYHHQPSTLNLSAMSDIFNQPGVHLTAHCPETPNLPISISPRRPEPVLGRRRRGMSLSEVEKRQEVGNLIAQKNSLTQTQHSRGASLQTQQLTGSSLSNADFVKVNLLFSLAVICIYSIFLVLEKVLNVNTWSWFKILKL